MARDDATRWMWLEASATLARAERLQCQFFQISPSRTHVVAWEPPADVLESRDFLHVILAMPGVAHEAINVALDGNRLTIVGDRVLPDELNGTVIHRLELPYGRFERTITLPGGKYANARCVNEHGCLIVTLNKIN